ncbi:MAG: hypothetical protein K6B43_03470 [Treponema sp.]|nr:hypothetical protein [Treponema sp.]
MELKMDNITENVVAYIAERYFSLTNKFIAQILMYKILALVDFRSVSEVGIPCTSLEYWADKRGPVPHALKKCDGFSVSTTEAKNVFPKYLKSKPDGRLVRNIKKLNKIASLETGWNGDDANSFSDSFLNRVRAILLSIENQPEIFPTAADSIQMEFDGKKNSYLEIQIRDSDTAEVYEVSRNGEEYSYEIVASEQTISQIAKLQKQ